MSKQTPYIDDTERPDLAIDLNKNVGDLTLAELRRLILESHGRPGDGSPGDLPKGLKDHKDVTDGGFPDDFKASKDNADSGAGAQKPDTGGPGKRDKDTKEIAESNIPDQLKQQEKDMADAAAGTKHSKDGADKQISDNKAATDKAIKVNKESADKSTLPVDDFTASQENVVELIRRIIAEAQQTA